jgi:hypothetical protein
VFAGVADSIGSGFVASLARRGGSQVCHYLEVPAGDTIADWPDERVWPLRF